MKGDKLIRFGIIWPDGSSSLGGEWPPKGYKVVKIAVRRDNKYNRWLLYKVCRRQDNH